MTEAAQPTHDELLDARGLKCPMPVVKARSKVKELGPGQVLKIVSTDRGSVRDFQGWTKIAKDVVLLRQDTEAGDDGELYLHYVQRVG